MDKNEAKKVVLRSVRIALEGAVNEINGDSVHISEDLEARRLVEALLFLENEDDDVKDIVESLRNSDEDARSCGCKSQYLDPSTWSWW